MNQFSKEINLIISEPDTGIYNAMNKGISIAKGNLIGFLNCDDEYAPGALKIILNSAASVHAGIYHGDTEYVASNGSTSIKRPGPIENITGDPTINHTTCFVTKQTYQQQGDFDEKYKISSDFDLMLRCYLKGVRFHYIPQTLNKFYWGGASSKCYSNVEGYRILKHHKTGKHLSLIPRMIKCYTKNFIKLVIGRF